MESKLKSISSLSLQCAISFNRTSMESKRKDQMILQGREILLIEPVWNRNQAITVLSLCANSLLIEPVWNRNKHESFKKVFTADLF